MIRMGRKNGLKRSQEGIALVVSLLVLMLITAIAAGMLIASNMETNVSGNFRDEQTAFFGARGGMEEARDRFRSNAPDNIAANLPVNLIGQNNAVLYITNPTGSETVAPWNTTGSNYPDDELCKERGVTCTSGVPSGSPWYSSLSASNSYAASPVLPWKWARVMAKTNRMSSGSSTVNSVDGSSTDNYRVCWTGTNQVAVTAASCKAANSNYTQLYEITALAVTPSGSRRMVQSEAASYTFPTLPGPLIFDGPSPNFNIPHSDPFRVNGTDQDTGPSGASCDAAQNMPAVAGYDPNSVTTLTNDIVNQQGKPNNYTGAGLPTPSVGNEGPALGTVLGTVEGLTALVSTIENAAGAPNFYSGNATALTNPGTVGNPVINVVKGNLTVSGGLTGAGILLVEGTLTMGGNPSWNGLIFVIGQGIMIKNGGGNGTTDGSILVARLYDNSSPPNLLTSGTPGTPSITWSGGGNASINYDSCWSTAMNQRFPAKIVAIREMMF